MWHRRSISIEPDAIGFARTQEIPWAHPRLAELGDAARLLYACMVDGCSDTARETLDSVDVVWRHRSAVQRGEAHELRENILEVIVAVEELLDAGLLVLMDRSSIRNGWVMRPWESPPS